MKYNLSFTVSSDVCMKAIEVSKSLVAYGGRFTLGMEENFPHITIAHFQCDADDVLHHVIQECMHSFSGVGVFRMQSTCYRNTKGWVDVAFAIDKQAQRIYSQSQKILQKHHCVKTSDSWKKNSPHITLSRIDENAHYDIAQLPDIDYSFVVQEITVSLLGENGTNKNILSRIALA